MKLDKSLNRYFKYRMQRSNCPSIYTRHSSLCISIQSQLNIITEAIILHSNMYHSDREFIEDICNISIPTNN